MTARKNNVSEAGRAAMRENVKKAQEASRHHRNIRPDSPAVKIIKGQNMRKAIAVRASRAILKAIPDGVILGPLQIKGDCPKHSLLTEAP